MKSKVILLLVILPVLPLISGAQLPRPADPSQAAVLAGQVVRAGSGEPLRRAIVTLRRVNAGEPGGPATRRAEVTVTTANDGVFRFDNVDPGQYRVMVERDGYIGQEFGQRTFTGAGTIVSIAPGQRLTDIQFQLVPAGTIAGRILDEEGEPLAGIQVQALTYAYNQGRRVLVPGRQVQTNDLGEYRLYWLEPGEYLVSATPDARWIRNLQRDLQSRGFPIDQIPDLGNLPAIAEMIRGRLQGVEPSGDETYASMYFPGSTDPEAASPIQLPPGAELRGIDFMLRPVRTAAIRGRIVTPIALSAPQTLEPPRPGAGGRGGLQGRGQIAQNAFRGSIQVMLSRSGSRGSRGSGGFGGQTRATVGLDGGFEIRNIVPGSYVLTAFLRQDNTQYSATMRIEVSESDLDNIQLALRPSVDVRGQIYVDGPPPAGFRAEQLRVGLTALDDLPMGNTNARVAADGMFLLPNVPQLTFQVNVGGLPPGAYLMAGRYGNADALNEPLQIGGDSGVLLQLQIGFSAGRVDGVVRDDRGQPFAGVTCVLIPAAPQQHRLDLYKTAATDQYGRFTFTTVAPGNYRIYAWEDIPQGAYQDPLYVSRFEDRATSVHVERLGAVTVQVPVIRAGLR